MEAKDTLFYINWGDSDDFCVVAPDEKTAIERMPDGKDIVNYIVRLDSLYQIIFKAGVKEVVEWVDNAFKIYFPSAHEDPCIRHKSVMALMGAWQAQLKDWATKSGVKAK